MASEYWLCVQIPATTRLVQTEKDKRRRDPFFLGGPSNFLGIRRTNGGRSAAAIEGFEAVALIFGG
ncbi:hypothetical protein [Pseudomonas sp. BF-R-01]|uniref:hypothetical protein n=1 Tax=Pseudomonas sp. BF-R-01 TaxID=2832365 RepID=UPI001CC07386|nr:hypothetical protein [Pseudomonas sp. BF-R-01]